jgi:RHS repeat-associated protein
MSPSRLVPVLLAVMRYIVGLLVIGTFIVPSSRAQQDYLLQLGTPPGSPTMPIPLGVVNLKNGNVHLEIPLRTLVQRNGLKLSSKLIYDSSNCFYMYGATQCISGWREVYSPLQYGSTPFPPYVKTSGNYVQCPAGGPNGGSWYTQETWSNFSFTDASGTGHPFLIAIDNSSLACTNNPGTPISASGYASDESGHYMIVTLSNTNGPPTWSVWDKSGNLMGSGKDTNGNFLSATDELGRSYMPGSMPSGGTGSQQWAGSTIQWQNIPIHSNFGNIYYPDLSLSISTISSITLPDNRTYQFIYDQGTAPGNYGQLIQLTLPTGGQVSFGHTNISPSNLDGPDRRLTSLSQGGATWNFGYNITYNPQSPPSSPSATTVTAPPDSAGVQNQSVYSFTAACLGPNATTPWSAKYYAGAASGSPLRENDVVLDCTGALVLQETTVLENGISSKVVWNYQSNNINNPGSSNIISKQEYDFSANLARETTANYQTSTTYTNLQITDRPLYVKVYGAGGAASGPLLAQTSYAYDSTPLSTTSGSIGSSVLGASGHDDANYGTGNTVRGNVTAVSQMVSPGNFITTKTNYYNILGEIIQTIDGRRNSILFDFTDKWASGSSCVPASTFAYPTTITYPGTVTNKKVTTYGECDGFVYSVQDSSDLNAGRPGTVYTYDGMQRVTNISFPDGGSQHTDYGGTAIPQIITNSISITSSLSKTSTTTLDALGRVTQTALTTDPDGTTYTATAYDALGRTYKAFNPTRCSTPTTNCGEATWGYVTYTYDALGRTTQITKQDGQIGGNSYNGNCRTTTDEAQRARKSCTDGLGRLTQVFEDPAGLNYETDYTYDPLDNLLTVNQKGGSTNSANWRTRRFAYDSLSRLLTATNPESGTVSYSYDASGNLASKTSPAPNQTGSATITLSYCYDALNRLTSKAYTAQSCPMSSPVATYLYDQTSYNGLAITNGFGRRTGMTDSAGTEAWSYDSMGRALADQRTTNGVTFNTPYTYNLDGSVATVIYPALNYPLTVTFQPGGAGRPLGESSADATYASNVHYAPNGSLCYMQAGWGQSFTHIWTFNNRLQPARIQLYGTSHGASSPLCSASTDPTSDIDFAYSYTDASGHNNGNVAQIANNDDWHRWQYFTYDSLNRIATAKTAATNQPAYQGDNSIAVCWGEQFGYDPWGNLLGISAVSSSYTGCTQESLSVAVGSKNQIIGNTYDAAGNLIIAQPGNFQYTYDAENHLIATAGQTYLYDGDGKRVEKASGTPLVPNKLYWYGQESNPIYETDATGNELDRYFYFAGRLVTREEASDWVDHYGLDALGNVRWVYSFNTGSGGADVSDYYPFGGERVLQSSSNNNRKFTGKERDSESGLDNFGARYNSSAMGRWMSPDRINLTSARLVNPGNTLNKYVYGANNPLKYVDRDGEDITVFYKPSGSGATDFGHIFIGAFNQSTGRVGFLDYYPKSGTDSLGRGPGTFNNGNMQDRAAQADQFATLTIRTSPEEAQKVLNLIDKLKSGSAQDYAALSNNCTTVCEDVLHDLGLDFGDITPDQYWADLYRNFSQDVQDNPFKAFPFTQVPRQTGIDYGNPRNYGINFTQLLFLLYQYQNQSLPKATVCTNDHLGNTSCSTQ